MHELYLDKQPDVIIYKRKAIRIVILVLLKLPYHLYSSKSVIQIRTLLHACCTMHIDNMKLMWQNIDNVDIDKI